ncbi:30S ribosomal protein S7 [PVC group bacterium]|nr:30S ribosomal protein S7 [PVC group bacterium]MCH7589847.1 30S ribosomal protein S7 [PVC group bacterium]
MSRRRRAPKRHVLPDPLYSSELVMRTVGMIMQCGKKTIAESIVYGAMDTIKEKTKTSNVLEYFEKAVNNVKPILEVRSRRVGGATYQIPVEVRPDRRTSLALRWIISYSRGRKGKPMKEKFAQELMDAYNQTGAAFKKREDTHKMAEANKAFAHYRW